MKVVQWFISWIDSIMKVFSLKLRCIAFFPWEYDSICSIRQFFFLLIAVKRLLFIYLRLLLNIARLFWLFKLLVIISSSSLLLLAARFYSYIHYLFSRFVLIFFVVIFRSQLLRAWTKIWLLLINIDFMRFEMIKIYFLLLQGGNWSASIANNSLLISLNKHLN